MDNMLRMQPHPDNTGHGIEGFNVGFILDHKGKLWLRYHVDCDPGLLVLPDTHGLKDRADNLWKSTCFEAFMRVAGSEAYVEFNFAPSGQWAAYAFRSYRDGITDQPLSVPPDIGVDASDNHIAVEVVVQLPHHFIGSATDMALTAILHEQRGEKSFWSLVHPQGKPDFHHQACFALKLAPPITS
ncbi:MAG: DOMON-like domain-containing protein [Pseudomonadota bacterium]